ncbi:hypothetical protein [Clostridioides difficile]|uniref:hypothetical protein n=1 Tax=Clostridioides difficile TaxID=1496 RepID=UPI00038DB23B|nr:hypothetical protein [Clostridioides difficile]EQE22991.1 hypothetical protein QAW_0901 [Clostridioides difficile CD17]EQK08134.1 hypothetical protein QUI_1046 [Clostridioides difficile P59]MDI2878202.1 hypothetical protein [Clostridioides difficile]MDI2964386.1 hypothetical protein [Clostridioides difficile]MDI2994264.1 hypothetical protein [Clostridioides difficile]
MKKQFMALGLSGLIGLGGLGLLVNKSFADTSNRLKGDTTVAQGLDRNATAKDVTEQGDTTVAQGLDRNATIKDVVVNNGEKSDTTVAPGLDKNATAKDVVEK